MNFNNPKVKELMFKGCFGLEKESLRVDTDGFLSHTPHPFMNNPNIDRDFCENQTEIITNVCDSVESVCNELESLNRNVIDTIWHSSGSNELLWPFSNPPYVKNETDIPVANFTGNLKGKELYRQYLAEKYGKMKMLYSGIHFNFSFSDELLSKDFCQSTYSSFSEYINSIYLRLAKKTTQYSWLIVYLTAASSVMDGSFINSGDIGKDVLCSYSSPRCSKIGYWNDFIPLLDYENIESYVKSIQSYVDSGQLISASELYYPVRLKPSGENSLENLQATGVNHIELRMLDLNPLSPFGVIKEDIYFLHLLIIYLMSLDEEDFDYNTQVSAISNIKKAAEFDDENIYIEISKNKTLPIKQAAYDVIQRMEKFFSFFNQPYASAAINYQKEKILNNSKRYAVIVREKFGKGYVESGLLLAKSYAENTYTNLH